MKVHALCVTRSGSTSRMFTINKKIIQLTLLSAMCVAVIAAPGHSINRD